MSAGGLVYTISHELDNVGMGESKSICKDHTGAYPIRVFACLPCQSKCFLLKPVVYIHGKANYLLQHNDRGMCSTTQFPHFSKFTLFRTFTAM